MSGSTVWISNTIRYMRIMLLLASVVFASGAAVAQSQAPGSVPYIISVDVEMVALHATVVGSKGQAIAGLAQGNFQIYEDGILQPLKYFSQEDIPVTVGLVIDNSGSMGRKRADVLAAALAFARASNPKDEMFVVNFNEKVSFALPPDMPFTDSVTQLEEALSSFRAIGQTALYDAMDAALDHLSMGRMDKKVLIVISDGGDNASTHTLDSILLKAKHSNAIIYSVGIYDEQDEDRRPGVLKRFAADTGGEVFLPAEVRDVVPICKEIAREIRSQYTLSYLPTNKGHDGAYRLIQVRAIAAGRGRLLVRTRSGYFASPAPERPGTTSANHEPH
jgi:VWFA-related protein